MKKHSFTFVELLVVITVILILIGISVPIYAIVKKKARVTQTHAQVSQLRIAITGYESTYQYLPLTPSKTTDATLSSAEYTVLIGALSGANPRGLKFLELETPGTYADPWDKSFKVAMDFDYDGVICEMSGSPAACTGHLVAGADIEFPSSVAIWSMGPDGLDNVLTPDDPTNDDNVTSWQKE